MPRTSEEIVNTLRDAVERRRRDLPLPATVSLDELLEEAADLIEDLEDQIVSESC